MARAGLRRGMALISICEGDAAREAFQAMAERGAIPVEELGRELVDRDRDDELGCADRNFRMSGVGAQRAVQADEAGKEEHEFAHGGLAMCEAMFRHDDGRCNRRAAEINRPVLESRLTAS